MRKNQNKYQTQVLFRILPFLLWLFLSCSSDIGVAQTNIGLQVKGFHIDLRAQVMTITALKKTATSLAEQGINTIIMEWEATYPYLNHATLSNQKAYTREEIFSFIKHCNSLGIDVIPLQQCFGHVEYILRHYRYAHLRENRKEISQLCPLKTEAAKELFKDLFSDLIATHNSNYIHLGGDETYLLGYCENCKLKVETEGVSKLYTDYMKTMCEIIIDMNKIPVIWADMVLQHPETLDELPEEVVLVDWNYGWDINYFGNIEHIQKKKNTIWGAPSIRSHPDDWYLICWEKHFNNIRDYIPYAREAGYDGVVMTSWSTSGLYGFTWDIGWDVIDMQQIRNVYPMAGFNILIEAYTQSLKSTKSLHPEAFVTNYAQKEFGLNAMDALKFWKILAANPIEIINGQPRDSSSIRELKDSILTTKKMLEQIIPANNVIEFEHFGLMVDMRLYYINLKILENKYNADNFSRNNTASLLQEVEKLLRTADEINQRFTRLNTGYLKDIDIIEQNKIRNQRLNILYDRLKQQQ